MEPAESTAPDHDVLYRIAYAACGDHDLSEDAAAESMSRALITTRESVTVPWYKTVITNIIRDDHRKKQRLRHASAETLDIVLDPSDTPDERAERQEMLGAVAAEFAALPEALRSILQLRIVDGLSMKEASAALDVPVGTLEKRVSRGIRTLRERFERRQLAGGITVAGAIRRSGRVVPAAGAGAVGTALTARLMLGLASLIVAVGGVTWAILRSTSPGDLDSLDPVPPGRTASVPGAGGAGLASVEDRGADARVPGGSSTAPDEARGSSGDPGPAADASEDEPATYELAIQITIDGQPVEDWKGYKPVFEPYAQAVHEKAQAVVEQTPESDAQGTLTYTMPMEPRGQWQVRLERKTDIMDPPNAGIAIVMDPLSQLEPESDGSRRIEIDLTSTTKTFAGGKSIYTPNTRTGLCLVQTLRPGVWVSACQGLEDTGDDLVFPEIYSGYYRMCRTPTFRERTDPGGYPDVDPRWEGHIE